MVEEIQHDVQFQREIEVGDQALSTELKNFELKDDAKEHGIRRVF